MRIIPQLLAAAVVAFVVIYALGPAEWAFRTGLGWKLEHFLGYFAVSSIFCLVWPRPVLVGLAVMAGAALLEALQGLTPDRSPNLLAGLISASGVLSGAAISMILIRMSRRDTA